jgi:hypothetical protein
MPAILQPAEFQAIDADGHPMAGGTLATYVPGTTTPKATYQNEALTAQNTNPVVLDSSGRAILWGDGLYRTVLRDAAGNLIYDQTSTTVVSAAMEQFALAPSLAEAMRLLGVEDAIDAAVAVESAARIAADNALSGRIDAEVTRATGAEAALGTRIDAETAARIAADNALSDRIDGIGTASTGFVQVRSGTASTDASGNVFIPFTPPFPNGLIQTNDGLVWLSSDSFVLVGWTMSISGMGGQVLNNLPEGEPDTPAAFVTADWHQMGY